MHLRGLVITATKCSSA